MVDSLYSHTAPRGRSHFHSCRCRELTTLKQNNQPNDFLRRQQDSSGNYSNPNLNQKRVLCHVWNLCRHMFDNSIHLSLHMSGSLQSRFLSMSGIYRQANNGLVPGICLFHYMNGSQHIQRHCMLCINHHQFHYSLDTLLSVPSDTPYPSRSAKCMIVFRCGITKPMYYR